MNARDYLMLPWSIRGPFRVTDEFGSTHHEMRIAQLPDFLVAAPSESEVLYEFKPALLAFLESYTSEGEVPPHPVGEAVEYVAPYAANKQPPSRVRVPAKDATGGGLPARVALI